MKRLANEMKRGLAMFMAIVMVLSLFPAGLISRANAVGTESSHAHLSDLLVEDENYGSKLTALKKLLGSGALKAEKEIAYAQPEEGIVEVDSVKKMITATESNGWVPVSAKIMVGTELKETVALTNGEGTYTYAGNAFSVVVSYELYVQVSKDAQLALLNAAYYLAEDNANVSSVRDGIAEQILAELVAENAELKNASADIQLNGFTAVDLIHQLATDGIELPALTLGGKTTTLKFLDVVSDSIDDAEALLADKNDDGKLALHNLLTQYSAMSDLELLDKHGAGLKVDLNSNYNAIYALAHDDYGLAYVLKVLTKYNKDAVKAIADAKAELEEKKAQLETLKDKVAELNDAKVQLQEARAQLDNAKNLVSQYDTAKAELDKQLISALGTADYDTAKQLIAAFGDPTGGTLTQAIAYVEDYADDVATAKEYIATYEPQLIEAERTLSEKEKEAEELLNTQGMSLATIDADIAAAEKQIADAEAYLANAETNLLPQLTKVEGALDTLIKALNKFCTTVEPAYNCDMWHVMAEDILVDDLTFAEYAVLSNQIAQMENIPFFTEQDLKDTLYVTATNVQYNMAMFNVNIVLNVYKLDGNVNSNNLIVGETVTGIATLEQGANTAAIQAAIEAAGVKAQSDLTHYADAVVSLLPETLTQDITYTIDYYPEEVSFGIYDGDKAVLGDTVYYGFLLKLPAYAGVEEQVYEYSINGLVYAQNEVVTITENTTILRSQGKPRTGVLLKDILGNNLTGGLFGNAAMYQLTETAQGILSSAALISNGIRIRVPGDDAKIQYVGTDVVVSDYASDLNGLFWKPVSIDFIDEKGGKVNVAVEDGKAAIPAVDFARVSVNFELMTGISNADVLKMLNLPLELRNEYNAQVAALAILDAKYSALSQLDKGKVNMLVTVAKDKNLGDEICGAAESIRDNCLDADGKLKLYNLLTGYKSEGMVYYYRNYEAFVEQTTLLTAALDTLWGNADNQAALLAVMYEYADVLGMSREEIDGYIEPLGQLLEALNEMKLVAPNAALNLDSDALEALVELIASNGDIHGYEGYMPMPRLYTSVAKTAANYTSVEVRVFVNGTLVVLPESQVSSLTFKLDNQTQSYTLNAEDAVNIMAMINDALAYTKNNAAYDLDAFFTVSVNGKDLAENSVITGPEVITYNFTAKEYIVSAEGAPEQIISVNTSLKVNLPASGVNTMLYEYMIDGVKVPAGTYTFTTEQLKKLFKDGSYTVERIETEQDPVGDALQNVVNNMNGGDVKVELESTKNQDGTYNYVMDMYIPGSALSNPNALAPVGMALFGSYTYIEMNDEVLLNGTSMYMQTLLNAVMDSGLDGKRLQQIAANNGGLMMSTKLALGAYEGDADMVTTTLNVHLVGDSAELDQTAAALKYFEKYVTISCVDGGLVINMTLPEKAYQAYLAAMLVLSQRDLKNLNDIDAEVAFGYMQDVMDPVLTNPDLDLETFTNTLALLGYDIDGSRFAPYFDRMIALYNSLTWNYAETGVATSLTGGTSAVNLLKNSMGALGSMIKDEAITINVSLYLTNLANDYEAAYVDVSADGITNKVGLLSSLADKKFAGKAVIVLLSDIGAADAPVALMFNDTTIIDLNGYTIYGDLTAASGSVYLVESSLDNNNPGGVTGKISGKVAVTAGVYAQNVSAFLMNGYVQDANGIVRNSYYDIDKNAEGDYTVTLNPAAVNPNELPDVKSLALDILFDLVINGYTNGSMSINGCKLYDIAVGNIVDVYLSDSKLDKLITDIINGTATESPWINVAELAKLYNMLVADLTNFKNIATGDYIARYEITTATWDISVFVDGDHISGGLGAVGEETKKNTLTIVLADDTTADKIKDLAGELGNVVDVKSELEMSQHKNGNNIMLDAVYKESSVVINLATDVNYIRMLGILLADVVSHPAALNKGLSTLDTYGTTRELKTAIDKCTVSDLLTALANVNRGYDFSKLGAKGTLYKETLMVAGAVIRKLDIADKGSRTLGSMESQYATYVLDKENMDLDVSTTIRSYKITASAKIPYASVTVILCDACAHANTVKVDAKPATCTDDGNIDYWYCNACGVCFADENCNRTIAKEDTVIPATGHSYEVVWSWAADYTSATAEFTCSKCDMAAAYAKDSEIDSVVTEEATCSKAGTIVYTAKVQFAGVTYTDSKEVALEKLEHPYTSAPIAWAWNEDLSGATATFVCNLCSEQIAVNAVVSKVVNNATCSANGSIVCTATAADSNGTAYTDVKVQPLAATGHTYRVSWTWADDFSSAKATFTCANCDDIHDVLDAEVTTNGEGVYVATVNYSGVAYVDIRTEEHSFVLDGWTWAADYTEATAYFTCSSCGEMLAVDVITTSETTPATCAKAGQTIYTATLTLNGMEYSATMSVEIPKVNHTLEHVAANGATCTEDGNIEYWCCSACGKYFADAEGIKELTKAETVITATGHSFSAVPTWAWSESNDNAVAKFICDTCGYAHFEEVKTQSTKDIATCTKDGKIIYSATVSFGDQVYTATKEVVLPATGHTFQALENGWRWSEDHLEATLTIKCSCGETKELDAIVTVKVIEATSDVPGSKTYTAVAFWNGQRFIGSYVETLEYCLSLGKVTMNTDNHIVGAKVTDNGFIFLDVQPNGITIDDLQKMLWVEYEADRLTISLVNTKEGNQLIGNGSVLTLIASNKDGRSVEKSYVLIILGDVNGNGRIEVADSALIAAVSAGTYTKELSEYARMAADLNGNDRLDVGDAAKNANKIVYWENYKSQL